MLSVLCLVLVDVIVSLLDPFHGKFPYCTAFSAKSIVYVSLLMYPKCAGVMSFTIYTYI